MSENIKKPELNQKKAFFYFGFRKVVPFNEVQKAITALSNLQDIDDEIKAKINSFADEIDAYFDSEELKNYSDKNIYVVKSQINQDNKLLQGLRKSCWKNCWRPMRHEGANLGCLPRDNNSARVRQKDNPCLSMPKTWAQIHSNRVFRIRLFQYCL